LGRLEIAEVVPVGGGGLIAGVAGYYADGAKMRRPGSEAQLACDQCVSKIA
jgi:hypothetical protein